MTWAPKFTFSVTWDNITGKPLNYPTTWSLVGGKPSTFPSTWATVSDKPASATRWPTWNEVTGKPSEFPVASHTHSMGVILGLESALDEKVDTLPTNVSDWNGHLDAGLFPIHGISGTANAPSASHFTGLHIGRGGPGYIQVAWRIGSSDTDAEMYWRHANVDGQSPWVRVWAENNFDPASKADSARTITAGNGLSGGGSLASNRTITLGTPGTLSGSTNNAVQTSSHTHALSTNLSAWDEYHPDNAFVDKGSIPGSVDLNTYRTTGIYHQNANADAASGTNYPANVAGMLTVYESSSMTYQTYQVYSSGDLWTRSRYNTNWSEWKLTVDGTTTISAGNGLSGGGSLSANRTISMGTPGTITGSTTNATQTSSHTHALSLVAGDIPNLPASKINSGTLSVARGGTGQSSFTSGNYLVGNGTGGFLTRTSEQTLANIGAAPLSAPVFEGPVTVNSSGNSGRRVVLTGAANDALIRANSTGLLYIEGNGVSIQPGAGNMDVNGSVSASDFQFSGGPRVPRTFVQSGDPGSNASTGDLWIW